MRSALLIIFLLAVSVPQKALSEGQQPVNTPSSGTNAKTTNQTPPSTVVLSQVVGNEQIGPSQQEQIKSSHVESISTIVIAIFTFLTFLVYRAQLKTARVAERAWMVSNSISELPVYSSLGKQPVGQTFPVRFLQTNLGRTPAWVTALGSKANLLPTGQSLPVEPI
jgi:hypothetical protein